MSKANDSTIVKTQYSSDKNLKARIELNKNYSTNKYGWFKWVFDQYVLNPQYKVIEFGCGNGAVWKDNKCRMPQDIEIILSDLSEGMLSACSAGLEDTVQIKDYEVLDIHNIPYEDNSFDVVIANHMLYHVPDRERAIKEVYRILKPQGTFYATTNGTNSNKVLKNLVKAFDSRIDYSEFSVANEFGLANGAEQLSKCFSSVEMHEYEDSLHITKAQPLVDYVLSLEGHTNVVDIISGNRVVEFYNYIDNIISSMGSIDMGKPAGIFIAKK